MKPLHQVTTLLIPITFNKMKKIIIILSAVAIVTILAFTVYNSGKGSSENKEGMIETPSVVYDSSQNNR